MNSDLHFWKVVAAHLIAAGVVVVTPVHQHFTVKRLKDRCTSKDRIKHYRFNLADAWISTVVIFRILGLDGVLNAGGYLSQAAESLSNPVLRYSLLAVAIAFSIVALIPLLVFSFKPGMREVYTKAASKAPFAFFLPSSIVERRYFAAVSITAGICEEIICRSFMVWYFAYFLNLNVFVAFLLSSVVFGIGHKYQGPAGMIKTGVVGIVLGLLYFTTGSLLVPIVIHALIDLAVVVLYRPERLTVEPVPEDAQAETALAS